MAPVRTAQRDCFAGISVCNAPEISCTSSRCHVQNREIRVARPMLSV